MALIIDVGPDNASRRPGNIFYGWWIVLACFLISLYVGCIVFYGFTAFFDPLVKEFGWSYTEISFALSLRGLEMSLLSPVFGFLVDHYGPRRLALWGVIAIGAGFVFLSFTQSLPMFYSSIILIAFGVGGCATVVFMRVVTNWFRRKIGLAFGLLTSGFGASGILIPAVVWLIDDFGWRTAVVILGVVMWVIGIPLVFVIRDNPETYGLLPDGDKTESQIKVKSGETVEDADGVSFRDALRHKAFLFLTLSEGIRMMVLMAVITHIMPYLDLLHIPRTTAGFIAGLVSVLSIAGRLGFGWLSDFFDKRYIIAISLGLMSLGMFALCHADIGWVMILFLVLFPTGFGGVTSIRGAILQEYFGRKAFGRLIGLVMGVSAFGGMIGPTLAGFIFDTTGSYYYTWIGFGIANCFSIILMLSVDRKAKKA
jgi:OFA family oxalate/formate antiporter-like MFS transporter